MHSKQGTSTVKGRISLVVVNIIVNYHSKDRVNGFECRCAPGYHGDQCETERDECAPNPCQNAIRCHVS